MKDTVLIIDDDIGIRNLISHLLSREGYLTSSAQNGHEALELLARSPELPAMILLDLHMPVLDGWRFRELQLENPRTARIPVVVITSAETAEQDVASIKASAYLKKPIEAALLLRTVRDRLFKR